jgi:fructoselysine 6-phosphate deglycase
MEYLQSMIFTPLLRNYAIRLADDRGHPLTVRRYMWRMDY